MIKQYRLKSKQMGLPEGTIFTESEWTTGCFASRKGGVEDVILDEPYLDNRLELFELVTERWHPKDGDSYYYINEDTEFRDEVWNNHPFDKSHFANGNCFKTREQTEEAVKRVKQALLGYHAELAEKA